MRTALFLSCSFCLFVRETTKDFGVYETTLGFFSYFSSLFAFHCTARIEFHFPALQDAKPAIWQGTFLFQIVTDPLFFLTNPLLGMRVFYVFFYGGS